MGSRGHCDVTDMTSDRRTGRCARRSGSHAHDSHVNDSLAKTASRDVLQPKALH